MLRFVTTSVLVAVYEAEEVVVLLERLEMWVSDQRSLTWTT